MPPSALRPKTCRSKPRVIQGGFWESVKRRCTPLLLVCIPLFPSGLTGQKRVFKQLLDPSVESILIEGEQCFRIELETAKGTEVRVEAEMQGEYQNALLIQTEMLGQTLRISTGFAPDFDLPNDKLGAHKVFSVSLKVLLPEDQRVELLAVDSQVRSSGRYRSLKGRLDSGIFELRHQAERTEIHTRTAKILARIPRGTVQAESRYGAVRKEPVPEDGPIYILESISGDIRVSRRAEGGMD